MKRVIKVALLSVMVLGSIFTGICIVEVVYRYQLIDFYAAEFEYLNAEVRHKKSSQSVLVIGDSFSAADNSYVNMLNDSFPNIRFLNASVPGTGIQEQYLIAQKRIGQVKPAFMILQLYVGNDLLDIEKPINMSTVPFVRNVFWFLGRHFYVVRFMNYRLAQMVHSLSPDSISVINHDKAIFNSATFSKRERTLLQADPQHFEKSALLQEAYADRYRHFQKYLDQVVELCKQHQLPLMLVVVPACCQVNPYYLDQIKSVGGMFTRNQILEPEYPFIKAISRNTPEVVILNPLPSFQKHDTISNRLYDENDLHLSDKGSALLAQLIISKMKGLNRN